MELFQQVALAALLKASSTEKLAPTPHRSMGVGGSFTVADVKESKYM